MKRLLFVLFAGLSAGVLAAESNSPEIIALRSPAFQYGEQIPPRYTCSGANVSPALNWDPGPPETQSYALIAEDPDASASNPWVHWVMYNIPPEKKNLSEKIPADGTLRDGSRQGRNDFKDLGYGGPCPPPGPAHRYFFRIYALNKPLNLEAGATRDELLRAMSGSVRASGELMGTFRKK